MLDLQEQNYMPFGFDLYERTMTVSEVLQDKFPSTALLKQRGDNLSAASIVTCHRI
jgi:hypothetical protein